MPTSNTKLTTAVEDYLTDLRRIRASGGATGELSYYGSLEKLLNAVGGTLKPKTFCVAQPADQGAGHPDFGLYTAKQVQRRQPREGQISERGVVEVKPASDDAWLTAESDQVSRYWEHYGLVLVTNTRDFVLVGKDPTGRPVKLETFCLADNAEDFARRLEHPRAFVRTVGAGLGEYLCRVLSHRAALTEPKDLAWLLASYARDGLSRVEATGNARALRTLRSALEEALGVRFEEDKGKRFFYSTLVQTLFYGVFSAWVLWARQMLSPTDKFNWHEAVWHLRVPVLRALFQQLSDPGRLQPLGLVEVLDWTAAALDRVDRPAFFASFSEGEAIPYFYEPFLEAFDPKLRKQLGVWYTPVEVVRYMVARVDKALKDDLGIADGLAAENVYVLDPCCGTGAYLAEVLRRITTNLAGQGLGALVGARVKQAAMERVFGFEIMPAPFVVAHLQVGLTMQSLAAPLVDDENERPSIFFTNALTGWEPTDEEKQIVAFPELEQERDRANQVKRDRPILVILGNPPYDGFAGLDKDKGSEAYRTTRHVHKPEGQGLNEPYVRFFHMAERRIAEKTGRGVICFISNYSWLDGLSHTGMRERYLEAFDTIRIDCLNGDSRETGKVAPDGSPDPSIFSTQGDSVGIQVGIAIATLVRKADHMPTDEVGFRHLWGQAKHAELTATAEDEPSELYNGIEPDLRLRLPFKPIVVSDDWFDWPTLSELLPKAFSGVQTGRDEFLVDTDIDQLKERIANYFDPALSHGEIARRYSRVMTDTGRFDARTTRDALLTRGGPVESGFVRYAYRPFDTRWLYYEEETRLLREKSPRYPHHIFPGNLWIVLQKKARPDLSPPLVISDIGDLNQMNSGVYCVPAWLRNDDLGNAGNSVGRPNLSGAAQRYLRQINASVEDLFHHVLAVLHDPAYHEANAGALRMEGPRIPLPGWPEGDASEAAEILARSAARGRQLAALLDPETPVLGVTTGTPRSDIATIAVPAMVDGHNMAGNDFALTVGWGHYGTDEVIMPGKGRVIERDYTADERAALGDAAGVLGQTTLDIYLNVNAYWRNVPAAVWRYKLGGYQVLKKWLSYRERGVLGRALMPEEVLYFAEVARRIGAIVATTDTPGVSDYARPTG